VGQVRLRLLTESARPPATILAKMNVVQPAARMFVELSKSQDVVAGDGTTSVTVLAGSILGKCMTLVGKGVHPTVISDALGRCATKCCEVLRAMAAPVALEDRDALIRAASTSLNSKVVSQYSSLLAPIAVDCVLRVLDPARPDSVDLRDVKVVKRLGGTVDDTTVVEGLVFDHKTSKAAGGPTRVENAKIALIQASNPMLRLSAGLPRAARAAWCCAAGPAGSPVACRC
jgi:T-complex protein 1 subunit delta